MTQTLVTGNTLNAHPLWRCRSSSPDTEAPHSVTDRSQLCLFLYTLMSDVLPLRWIHANWFGPLPLRWVHANWFGPSKTIMAVQAAHETLLPLLLNEI